MSHANLEIKLEINPLYEEEIEFYDYESNNVELANELAEIKQMFAQIMENEIKIQRDISFIKHQKLKMNLPVEVTHRNPKHNFSSANREFDLSKMNLPCSSLDDVYVLEKELNENLFFEIFFKNLLLEIESYDLGTFVKSAMQSIVNDDVTAYFSWYGLGDNIEIRSFKFIKILTDVCSIKFNQTGESLIVRVIQKCLLLAKDKVRRSIRDEENEMF